MLGCILNLAFVSGLQQTHASLSAAMLSACMFGGSCLQLWRREDYHQSSPDNFRDFALLLFLQGVSCVAWAGRAACGPGPGAQAVLLPVLELVRQRLVTACMP